MKFSCIIMFCLCANSILYAQSEPVPYWYNDRNTLKEGNNFAYAVGMGEGNTLDKAKENALDVAIKEAEAYLRGLNISEAEINSRLLKIKMNDNSNASWKIVCLNELKIENNNTKHKVYILYRFKKDIYKEFDDNYASIDCDSKFESKREEYYRNFYVGIAKTAESTQIGESYNLKIGFDKFSDFRVVTPQDGNLTLLLEAFAECTFFAIFNEDGKSFEPTKRENVSGSNSGNYSLNNEMNVFLNNSYNRGDYFQICYWNPTVEKFKGNFTFKLDGGTYYIRIFRSQKGLSTVNLSIQFKALK